MKRKIFSTLTSLVLFSAFNAFADNDKTAEMEKCSIVKDGKSLIKAGKNDGIDSKVDNSEAWIMVPKGKCVEINAGNVDGISDEIKDKIDLNALTK